MDLRRHIVSAKQIERAASFLNYQPFIISDDIQTGVAYSWLYWGDPRTKPTLVFSRETCSPEQWGRIGDTNNRLRAMYDDMLDEVARRFPGGSLFDVACNNGYFPVGAELRGMRGFGMDAGWKYRKSFSVLNNALGTKAKFLHRHYNSKTHALRVFGKFDVVVASAIMCHLPDPLHFLAALGKIARKAILFWGQIINTDELLISYNPSHAHLSKLTTFPHSFNDNTRISLGLFNQSMRLMGFRDVIELPHRPTWLSPFIATSVDASRPTSLEDELGRGSPHVCLLAVR